MLPPVKSVALLRDFDNEINDRRINTYNRSADGEMGRWYAAARPRMFPSMVCRNLIYATIASGAGHLEFLIANYSINSKPLSKPAAR